MSQWRGRRALVHELIDWQCSHPGNLSGLEHYEDVDLPGALERKTCCEGVAEKVPLQMHSLKGVGAYVSQTLSGYVRRQV